MEEIQKNTRQKGSSGEEKAVEYLLSGGYRIISRNYQSRNGEIDCIAEDTDGTLVFCEVKSARGVSRGHPFTWITRAKQRKIVSMARRYLSDHGMTNQACRFDVIAVLGGDIEHMKNAFLA